MRVGEFLYTFFGPPLRVGEIFLSIGEFLLRVGEFPHDAREGVEVSLIDEVVVGLDHDVGQEISLLFGKALEEPVAKLRDGGHEKYSC